MKSLVVVLHNIRSVHNVGSIFRTADAAGVDKVYLSGITPTPLDRFGKIRPQFAKISLGAEKNIRWEKCVSTTWLLDKLKSLPAGGGYKIFAIEQAENSIPYHRVKVKGRGAKVALVLGNEVRGLSPAILRRADKILEIPMRGRKESLNVSVAFGIVVYNLKFQE